MPFFDEHIATIVQLISAPLEIVGFGLAFIQIKSPDMADSIETHIQKAIPWAAHGLRKLGLRILLKLEGLLDNEPLMIFILIVGSLGFLCFGLLVVIVIYGFIVELIFPVYRYDPNVDWLLYPLGAIIVLGMIGYGISWVILLLSLALQTVSIFVNLIFNGLNDYTNGKALGAIGLILAMTGVLGEIYQVCVIFFPN